MLNDLAKSENVMTKTFQEELDKEQRRQRMITDQDMMSEDPET